MNRLMKWAGGAAVLIATAGWAGPMVQTATLRDLQTVGSTTKKQRHQQYDLVLDTPANEYVCRTRLGSSLNPTQFVVGTMVELKLNGQNGEATSSLGKRVKCSVVKVEAARNP